MRCAVSDPRPGVQCKFHSVRPPPDPTIPTTVVADAALSGSAVKAAPTPTTSAHYGCRNRFPNSATRKSRLSAPPVPERPALLLNIPGQKLATTTVRVARHDLRAMLEYLLLLLSLIRAGHV
jgi:hypothetical protein